MEEKEVKKKNTTSTKSKNKKPTTKKETPVKKVEVKEKVELKKEVKLEKTEPKKKAKKADSSMALLIAFCLLLVVVIVLSIVVIQKKHENKNKITANIVIPIVNKEDESAFNINVSELNRKGQYVFRIANYKDKEINQEDLNYTVDIKNSSDSRISVTQHGSDENLMVDQNRTIIAGGKLGKHEKDSLYYVIKILEPGTIKKTDLISVKITSSK